MFKSLVFLLLFCAAISQIKIVEASSKDEAKKAFHQLMEVIDKALTEAQKALNKAVAEFQAKAAELENKAKGQLDKVLEPLRKKLDDLVKKAEEKGAVSEKCQQYVTDFSNQPDQLLHNLVECLNRQLVQVQNYVNDALNNAKTIEQDLNKIDSEIDDCKGSQWKKALCYEKIIEKIARDTKEAPEKIVNDVRKTVELISKLVPTLEACFLDRVKDARTDAMKDVAEFGICAVVGE